jgi:TP901 family phage tail tape measure protein
MLNSLGVGINLLVKGNASEAFASIGKSFGGLSAMLPPGISQFGGLIAKLGPTALAIGATVLALKKLYTVLNEATQAAADFEYRMANTATLLDGAYKPRIKELAAEVERLQMATGSSAKDLQDGLYQTISAFGDSTNSIKKLDVATKGSVAGMSTVTDSLNLLSAVTKGYGDTSGEAVEKVSDLAFLTVKLGQTTFPELASSMGKVVPMAATMKIKQEELFGAFATLTGVTGTAGEVSTQLSSIMGAMIKPTAGLTKVVKGLGFADGMTMMRQLGLQKTLIKLKEAVGGNDAAFGKLLRRKEAMVAAYALTGGQADVFAEKLQKMTKYAGATERAFQIMKNTHTGAVKIMTETQAVFMQRLGRIFLPIRTGWVKIKTFVLSGLIGFVNIFKTDLIDPLKKTFMPLIEIFSLVFKGAAGLIKGSLLITLKTVFVFVRMFLITPFKWFMALLGVIVEGFKRGWGDIMKSIAGIKDALSGPIAAIRVLIGWIKEFGTWLKNTFAGGLWEFAVEKVRWMVGRVAILFTWLTGPIGKVGKFIVTTIRALPELIAAVFLWIQNKIIDFSSRIDVLKFKALRMAGLLSKEAAESAIISVRQSAVLQKQRAQEASSKLSLRLSAQLYEALNRVEKEKDKAGKYDKTPLNINNEVKVGNEKLHESQGVWEEEFLVRNFIPVGA